MPTTVIPPSSTRTTAKVATPTPRAGAAALPKKRRVIRRRGRARGELDSDDEIEREAASDSESEDEDLSSLDSADDSDTEPASVEDVIPHDRTHLPTPRNSKSPDSVAKEETTRMNGGVSFFAPTGDWSEMVTDEKDNGPADLPVIEFADFTSQSVPSTRKPKKAKKVNHPSESRAIPAQPIESKPTNETVETLTTEHPSTSLHLPRNSSQTARQNYQHKLETDPSFVPTIGNFWGHDDRLIDTELRSLSGWWRGRGRGRGRGFIRGRGGFQGSQQPDLNGEEAPPKDLPPIERAWTHDGFEDMKRKEEQRRAEQLAARNDQMSPKRGAFGGARGGSISGRGRGGFLRGGIAQPVRLRNASPFAQPGRVRFLMKPEATWTKQHESFLYFDPTLKPRAGQGPGFRVKLPGQQGHVVRGSVSAPTAPRASTSKVATEGSDAGDKYFVVRLPRRAGKERESAVEKEAEVTPIDEVFTVRPQLAALKPVSVSESTQPEPIVEAIVNLPSPVVQALPEATIRSQLEQLTLEPQPSDPERSAKTEQAVLRQPTKDVTSEDQTVEESVSAERPALAPLQTTFSPVPQPQPVIQPSPAYSSPYGYQHALPPGLAMNQHGMPYELATGRPVYLQPPAMYNPRPMMPSHFTPSMTFVPGHMHHPSAVSPDFLSQTTSQSPPMNGFIDPATGTPIFSFPRQTSRIEIRAPTEESERSAKSARTPSGLRTAAATFQPMRSVGNSDGGYYQAPSESGAASYDNMNGHASMEDAGMPGMLYPSYQQTYYYPEPYGYPPYVDMSQGGQYDMYNVDQVPQGTVYY